MIARTLQIIVGLAGLCALVLGLLIWIASIDLTDVHMLFGLLVTLGLLVMSIISLTYTSKHREARKERRCNISW